jgi:chromosome partitioning protein
MFVSVLASRKGGAGKTSLAVALSVECERSGYGPVAIIDLDPMGGLSAWWDARQVDTPILVRVETSLADTLAALRDAGVATVFVDTPPSIGLEVAEAMEEADLVLVPCQASPDDLRAVGRTVEAVARAGKPMIFIINRVKPRTRLTAEAAVALSQHGTLAPIFVHDRTDYAAAKSDGLTAQELEPGGKAAIEMRDLWAYIATRGGVVKTPVGKKGKKHVLAA